MPFTPYTTLGGSSLSRGVGGRGSGEGFPGSTARLRMLHPQLSLVWGDSAYAGTLVDWARRFLCLSIKIVTKRPGQTGFKVLARRWIVERSLSWLMNARRNVIDYERLPQHSEAHLTCAAITLMARRLTRKGHHPGMEPTTGLDASCLTSPMAGHRQARRRTMETCCARRRLPQVP